ncbi:Hypothetical protein HVR_LOCUS307 [uncultured virus]|nr:Hypothetical protein HVR_LOCUS307 [uncultured virus]
MSLPTGKNAEQLIENLIIQGKSPIDALIDVITPFVSVDDLNRIKNTIRLNHAGIIILISRNFPIIRMLGLSDNFNQKYFYYPSGRYRPIMNFVHKTIDDLKDKAMIVSSPQDKVKPTYFYDGQNLRDLPNPVILDGPIYIPVIRYASTDGVGYTINITESEKQYVDNTHCGTYYFYEPASDVFMLSNKTLVASMAELAYLYIAGDDARNKLSDILFSFNKPRSLEEQIYMEQYLNKIEGKEYSIEIVDNPPNNVHVFNVAINIEQKLCFLAKSMGFEAIIIIYETSERSYRAKTETEILDVRPRNISYNSLYRLKS